MDNLTIVIPFYQGQAYIEDLLSDLPPSLPVIIVDDHSDVAYTTDRPNVTVYRPERKGYFTGAVNYGIERCATDVLVLNQDVRLEGTAWLDVIEQNRAEYALIGERIKGTHPAFPHGYVHGVFQFMRRDAIGVAGLMDAKNYPLWGGSALWLWQICRRGFKALPLATIPGLSHARGKQHYGDSIADVLNKEPHRKDLLIRTPPMISVVIPSYNYGRYLSDAVHSLIGGNTSLGVMPGQSFQSFEIIIVDDASTDDTATIAQSFVDGWNGIRFIRRQRNGGTATANNTGFKAAVGTYCTHLSADDMREPWSLQDLYEAAVANPGRVIYDELVEFGNGKRSRKWPLAEYDFDLLLERNMMPAGILFPKKAWSDVGGYPEAMRHGREDWAFNVALGEAGYCGLKIGRSGYLYRREGQNRTLRNNGYDWRQAFQVQMLQLFPHLYRGDRPMACCGGNKQASRGIVNRGAISMRAQANLTSSDMVLLEYTGKNVGSTNYGGPGTAVSGRYYRFGGNQRDKIKYVDARDVQWFLEMRENGQRLFARAATAEPAVMPMRQVAPDPAAPNQAAAVMPTDMVVQPEVSIKTPGARVIGQIDPNSLTFRELQALELAPEQWAELLDAEVAGKNRSTVVNLIKERSHAVFA